VLERVGGLQTQNAPSGYVGLWSRSTVSDRAALTDALERRSVIHAWVMRVTIHMVSRRDYWSLTEAVREARRSWWMRAFRRPYTEDEIAAIAGRVRELLEDGPMRRAEIVRRLGIDAPTWTGVGLWLDLVRIPPQGTWDRPRADNYGLADWWIGPSTSTREQGVELALRRYLGGFGPAPVRDIASWAGLPVGEITVAAKRMRLHRFRDADGGELLDLPRLPIPDAETPVPVRFLPTFDAVLLANCRRAGILPEEYRTRIFGTKTPHSVGTVLVDGAVAAAWRPQGRRVAVEPFRRLDAATRREVAAEAEKLAVFIS
jgi:hypothetical protein